MKIYYEYNEIDIFENKNKKIFIYNRLNRKASSIDKVSLIKLLIQIDKNNVLGFIENFNTLTNIQKEIIFKILVDVKFLTSKEIINDRQKSKITFNPHQIICINRTFLKLIQFIIIYISIPVFILGFSANILYNKFGLNQRYTFFEIIFIIFIIVIFSVFFHELAHTIIAEYNGAFVPEMGIKFNIANNFFIPIFYTTILGKADLPKNKKISILLAGILINIQIVGISFLGSIFTVNFIHDIFIFIIIINFLMAVSNLTVILCTDGYLVLEEFFDIKNLNIKTLLYLKSILVKADRLQYQKSYIVYSVMFLCSVIIYIILGTYIILAITSKTQ